MHGTTLYRFQDCAVWLTVSQSELAGEDHCLACRCGGSYEAEQEELQQLGMDGEKEVLVTCDTCSLNIVVTLEPS